MIYSALQHMLTRTVYRERSLLSKAIHMSAYSASHNKNLLFSQLCTLLLNSIILSALLSSCSSFSLLFASPVLLYLLC
jgi:hypothetical protein